MTRKLTAIVLQGGGALGAYEFGSLKAFFERPGFKPQVVTGVSIGALSAAILAGAVQDPIATLGDMWDRLSVSALPAMPGVEAWLAMFGTHGMVRVNPTFAFSPLLATSLMDIEPLSKWLLSAVDFEKLNASEIRVVVTAVNAATGIYEEFDNREGLTVDHVIASASLPPLLPMTYINGSPYWDGGLISNTPLRCAINALERIEPDDPHVRRELIAMDCNHIAASTPQTLSDVIGRLLQIYFFGKLHLDLKLFEQFNTYLDLIEHLDDELPANSALRTHPAYRKLMAHRKIDRLLLVRSEEQESIGAAADFSRASTLSRIERGYRDAVRALNAAEAGRG
ncbi:patatin-like phospholipase family protein [Paraburkholderia mimosarum]|uniref:patatin-like phospholipase family protein n=1 Tax=Paraburkholderia mimosarum TaxID=312026 RepID=UPI00041041C7|nr:patatin-like phospholipase family protein [Paraburkholderia mimosarum]